MIFPFFFIIYLWVFFIAHCSVLQTVQSYWTECNKMNREEPVVLWKVSTEAFLLCFHAAILSTSIKTALIMHPINQAFAFFL